MFYRDRPSYSIYSIGNSTRVAKCSTLYSAPRHKLPKSKYKNSHILTIPCTYLEFSLFNSFFYAELKLDSTSEIDSDQLKSKINFKFTNMAVIMMSAKWNFCTFLSSYQVDADNF